MCEEGSSPLPFPPTPPLTLPLPSPRFPLFVPMAAFFPAVFEF